MAQERLQKYIANCGYCSRRKAELLIEAGLVLVNDTAVSELGTKVDPAKDTVTINGEVIRTQGRRTIALHKPTSFITSTHDTHDRLTVMDLLPRTLVESGVLPAGRLDLETEGLLILTNDGDLQHRITHPRYECEKRYHVELDRTPRREELSRLERGIHLRELGRTTAPAEIRDVVRRKDGTATLEIRIREGMKRQIRRMFEALGMTVVYLKRLSIGGVELGDLPRGEWRDLSEDEVRSLEGDTRARPAGSARSPRGERDDRPAGSGRTPAGGRRDDRDRDRDRRSPGARGTSGRERGPRRSRGGR